MEHQKRVQDYRATSWPEDLPQRLERLMGLAGKSWQELAELLCVTEGNVMRWPSGERPTGPNFWAIMELARSVPAGYGLILRVHVESGNEA